MPFNEELITWERIPPHDGKWHSPKKEWKSLYVLIWQNFHRCDVSWKMTAKCRIKGMTYVCIWLYLCIYMCIRGRIYLKNNIACLWEELIDNVRVCVWYEEDSHIVFYTSVNGLPIQNIKLKYICTLTALYIEKTQVIRMKLDIKAFIFSFSLVLLFFFCNRFASLIMFCSP